MITAGLIIAGLLILAFLPLTIRPLTAVAGSSGASGSYIRYEVIVDVDVIKGPLARYGFEGFYARILVSLGPNGTVLGTAYIVDSYPEILFTPYWRGYIEGVLNKALAVLSSSLKSPPATGGWVRDGSGHSIVFIVAWNGGQSVYKCKAVGWRASLAGGGNVRAYTGPSGRYPLYLEAEFTTSWYKVKVRAQAQYIHGMKSPCGHPVSFDALREILGVMVLAIAIAALIAYARRPRTPMAIVKEAFWP